MSRHGNVVAWGKRRRDYQLGSLVDERETCRLDRLAGAIKSSPFSYWTGDTACVGGGGQAANQVAHHPTQEAGAQ